MAIFGIGAFQDSHQDVAQTFLNRGIAGTNWLAKDAPAIHALLRQIKMGDLLYIKAFIIARGRRELRVKAVGIVTDNTVHHEKETGSYVKVRWIWQNLDNPVRISGISDPTFGIRSQTLYEENHPKIAGRVIDLLLSIISPPLFSPGPSA